MILQQELTPFEDAVRIMRFIDNRFDGSAEKNLDKVKLIARFMCEELISHLPSCVEFGIDENDKDLFHSSCYQYWELVKIEVLNYNAGGVTTNN